MTYQPEQITTVLEDSIDNDALPLVVCHAALQGYLMLNKYYSLTDESVVYRIAMSRLFHLFYITLLTFLFHFLVLHPRYKTSYFVHAKWPQQWITDAETLAQKVWTEKYKKNIPKPAAQTNPTNDICISIHWYQLSLILYIQSSTS